MMSVPSGQELNPFIVEMMPQFRTQICHNKNWREVAQKQIPHFSMKDADLREEMKRLSDLYASSAVEGLVEGFKCGLCKKEAFQRCKRCKSVWYCSKDCQVGDWPRHKTDCKKIQQQAS